MHSQLLRTLNKDPDGILDLVVTKRFCISIKDSYFTDFCNY